MRNKIIALVDYKNIFGSKHFATPYRSGMNKELLAEFSHKRNFELEYQYITDVDLRDVDRYKDTYIIYTSSEDIGYHYKSYIEDVIFGLSQIGAILLPEYKYLRANNNKVFMEFLRTTQLGDNQFHSKHYGSLKEVLRDISNIELPAVLKPAEGASGTGVSLVNSKSELIKKIKKLKNYSYLKSNIRDFFRAYKHKGYQIESRHRKKIIIQPLIPNLINDWKVCFFGKKLFVFYRPILKGRGIKASGGGYDNYFYGLDAEAPEGLFDYAYDIFNKMNVAHASLDIAFDGSRFYLIEFQALYFGTAGIAYSKGYFSQINNNWEFVENKLSIEQVYIESVIEFIEK